MDELMNRNEDLVVQLSELREKYSLLHKKYQKIEDENLQLHNECTKLTLKLEDLEQNNAELMKENKYLDIENDQQAMEYVQLKCKYDRLLKDTDQLKQNLTGPIIDNERPPYLPLNSISNESIDSNSIYSPTSGQTIKRQLSVDEQQILLTQLTLDDLRKIMIKLKGSYDQWYQIGVQLCVPVSNLKSLRSNPIPDADKVIEIVDYWLNNEHEQAPHCWNTLYDILLLIDQQELARSLLSCPS